MGARSQTPLVPELKAAELDPVPSAADAFEVAR